MKKFYDIKKGSHSSQFKSLGLKKVSKPNYFWDEENRKIVPKKKKRVINPNLKSTLGKILLVIFILIAFMSFVLARGYKAYADIDKSSSNAKIHLSNTFDALNNNDVNEAMSEAEKASSDIRNIRLNLQSWGQDSSYFNFSGFKKSKLTSLETLLKSADLALSAIVETRSQIGSMTKEGIVFSDLGNPSNSEIKISFNQNKLKDFFTKADKNLAQSEEYLTDIDPSKVSEFDINSAKQGITKLRSSLSMTGQILLNDLPWLTGEKGGKKDILILFLNNNELRGAGGFIGSFAVANFENGALKKLDFQTNIYNMDKAFSQNNQVAPPAELEQISGGKWTMHDSNWALDFPESAAKIKEFYKLESGKDVSGVIALDTTMFVELLKFTGPIEMPEYGLTVTSENFTKEVQYEVEKGYFEREGGTTENEPKKILAEMMPKFLTKFFQSFSSSDKLLPLTKVLSKALKEKHLVFQFDNQDFQSRLATLDYNGQIDQDAGDYLFISNSNVGGMKSSLSVKEDLKYSVIIDGSGSINSDLKINRQHKGSSEWPDGTNKNFVRVLIPLGSDFKLFEPGAGNFWPMADQKYAGSPLYEVGNEASKSKVSFWMTTTPGGTSDAHLVYTQKSAFDLNQEDFYYNLNLQKQIGSLNDNFELNITYPEGFKPENVINYDQKKRNIVIKGVLDQDKHYKIKFTKI